MKLISPAFRFLVPFAVLACTGPAAAEVIINELDADQPGNDNAEFIELYDGGVGNTSLDGYFLVLFNGANDLAYAVIDLAGRTTSPAGYFVVGNTGVPNVGLTRPVDFLQNGANSGSAGDAAALCTGSIGDIVVSGAGATPVGSVPSTVTVLDAVVYDGGSGLNSNDTGLLNGLGMSGQNMVHDPDAAAASAGRPNNAGGVKNMTAWSSLPAASPGGSNGALETLSLSFDPASFDESDGPGASTATLARTGPTEADLFVTLTSSDPSEAAVPVEVIIPSGSADVTFPVDAVNDAWDDGSHTVTITATAPLFITGSGTVTVNDEGDPAALLVVNEVHATGRGDANGDGTNAVFADDEFVEIVNVSAAPVDLSGWKLRDAAGLADPLQVRHTFPAGSVLNAGCALVIFGGGNPALGRTAAFGNAWIIKASGGSLALNDNGDVVSLQDGAGVEQAGAAYAAIAPADNTKSLNRNPDLTGPPALTLHTNVPGAGAANYSPGTQVDGVKFCTLTESFTVTLIPATLTEGGGTYANALTVSRPAPGTAAVWVTLTTSDASEAVPALTSLQFAAGVLSAQISVTAPDDDVADGPQPVTFTASSEGYLNGTASGTVNDDGLESPLAAVFINEVDCDTAGGTDALEFIELYDGGIGNKLMDGFIVVLYNGATNVSYRTIDLAGLRTNAAGYFVLGNAGVPGVGFTFPAGTLQNGADAIAIYQAPAASFPDGTTVTGGIGGSLKDALVYGTSDPDDAELLAALTPGHIQASETSSDFLALARRPNATAGIAPAAFVSQAPTPGQSNLTGSSYSTWAAAYPSLGGPDSDDDFDGVPNRLEFALGTHPQQPGSTGLPAPVLTAGVFRVTFNKGTMAGHDPSAQFIPEIATSLTGWTGTGITVVSDTAAALVFEYPASGPRVQARTRIVTP